MDLNYVKKLVKLLSESNVDEIEIEEDGKKVRLVKRGNSVQSTSVQAPAFGRTLQEGTLPTPLHLVTPAAPPATQQPASAAPASPGKTADVTELSHTQTPEAVDARTTPTRKSLNAVPSHRSLR